MSYLIKDNAIYESFENGMFTAWRKMNIDIGDPVPVFKGKPIPFAEWRKVVSWFYKHRSDEVQVRLFYSMEKQEWRVVPLPQYFPSGLSTKEIDGADADKIKGDMVAEGFQIFGSIHSHCSIGAFQSGTDHADEVKNAGIHITIGKLNDAELGIHGRVCLITPGKLNEKGEVVHTSQQSFHDADLTQWIEMPAEVAALHPKLQERALEFYMTLPVKEEIFPPEWEARLIPKPVTVYSGGGYGGHYEQGKWVQGKSWGDSWDKDSWSPDKRKPDNGIGFLDDPAAEEAAMEAEELQNEFETGIFTLICDYEMSCNEAFDSMGEIPVATEPEKARLMGHLAKDMRHEAEMYGKTDEEILDVIRALRAEEMTAGGVS